MVEFRDQHSASELIRELHWIILKKKGKKNTFEVSLLSHDMHPLSQTKTNTETRR